MDPITMPAPAAPTAARLTWQTSTLGVRKEHMLDVAFEPAPDAVDAHVTVTFTKPTGPIPVWLTGRVYHQGEKNAQPRAAFLDAIVGSGLLQTPSQPWLPDAHVGDLEIILNNAEGGAQPMWAGKLKSLPPEMQRVWDAAQQFMDDASVERKVSLRDLGKD